jgi:hypothetical protein
VREKEREGERERENKTVSWVCLRRYQTRSRRGKESVRE